jgi:uncharacterized protein YjeT (DUF2065 family)
VYVTHLQRGNHFPLEQPRKISLRKNVTLTLLAILLGTGLLAFGGGCLLLNEKHGEAILKILRNERLGLWIFTVAHLWFFVNLWQTDAKECEDFKLALTLFFGFAFVGCILYWKDFLIVRGIAVLTVLSVHRLLQIGYMSDHVLRPYVSGLFYFWIVLSLYFGVCPYRARDLVHTLFRNNRRRLKTVAGCSIFYGVLLIWLAF